MAPHVSRDPNIASGYRANPNSVQPSLPNSKWPDGIQGCPDPAAAQLERMPCFTNLPPNSAAARSRHAGGVSAVFLDGHVTFIRDSVSIITFGHLVSINDGQPVSEY
jgi:prepilin-type processing-associated H-X9-DG protein